MDVEEYITLKQAAHLGGYRNSDALYAAVRKGRLKAIKPVGGMLLTTWTWLAEYQAGRWTAPRDGGVAHDA
jgi:hypothetical protein